MSLRELYYFLNYELQFHQFLPANISDICSWISIKKWCNFYKINVSVLFYLFQVDFQKCFTTCLWKFTKFKIWMITFKVKYRQLKTYKNHKQIHSTISPLLTFFGLLVPKKNKVTLTVGQRNVNTFFQSTSQGFIDIPGEVGGGQYHHNFGLFITAIEKIFAISKCW